LHAVARISNLASNFHSPAFQCFAYILEKKDFDWENKMVEWRGAPWVLGALPPPISVISLKKVLVFISYLFFAFNYKTRVASENIIIREVKIPRFRFTGTSIAILFTNFC
jgi:hypothetical protein